jgi:hypothetical protein
MPRGFKKQLVEGVPLRLPWFQDERSFLSQPKGIDDEFKGQIIKHLILYGRDLGPIRAEIFKRNREANGGINRCWKCGITVFEFPPEHEWYANRQIGQWHHIRNKPGTRCDCPENGVVSCSGECHREEHPQVHFGAERKSLTA